MQMKKFDFPTRKDPILRPRRPAKRITRSYEVQCDLGSFLFLDVRKAIDMYQKLNGEAKLIAKTLYGYETIKTERLV